MSAGACMHGIAVARERARTRYDRNWRTWVSGIVAGPAVDPELVVGLQPPREQDLNTSAQRERARAWADEWRACSLPGQVEWETRAWSRVGAQRVPVRLHLHGADEIASWAGRAAGWNRAVQRVSGFAERFGRLWEGAGSPDAPDAPDALDVAEAVRSSVQACCALDEETWGMALDVLEWLLDHPGERRYARQLPIRGIDTKWVEQHGAALRPLYRALAGTELEFERPQKLFRCKACCAAAALAGCDEFALTATQLDKLAVRPQVVLVCENLVSVLCLPRLDGVLAVHGGGYAVTELQHVGWLSAADLLYWGDLDSNGFAILDALRSFASHARSVMMDAPTLRRHLDLCVEEPKPASGQLARLTTPEREALDLLAAGDPQRSIENLRLEQERIEWSWACERLQEALQSGVA